MSDYFDDPWDGPHNPTGYLSRSEMEYVESGQWDRDREEAFEAKRFKEQEAIHEIADEIGLEGKCKDCYYFYELAEGFLDEFNRISNEQLEFLRLQCSGCKGKGSGKPDPEHEERMSEWFDDLLEWTENMGMNQSHCPWCANVYRVFGQYKDPDDEWNAMENLCGNCKYWGEE
jgi:hypothetical protein